MRLIKEIKSKQGTIHFQRYELFRTPWFSIWLHKIYKHDLDEHLHNHPWDFISFVLKGSYLEELQDKFVIQKPFKVNFRNGKKYHKISYLYTPVVYTLFLVTPKKRDWGYLVKGTHIQHIEYRLLKNRNLL